jgi:hypothetical protein
MASKREQLVVSCTDHNPPKQELTSCITQSDAKKKKKRSGLQEGNENDRVGKGLYNLKGSNCWRHCAHKKAHSLTPYYTKKCSQLLIHSTHFKNALQQWRSARIQTTPQTKNLQRSREALERASAPESRRLVVPFSPLGPRRHPGPGAGPAQPVPGSVIQRLVIWRTGPEHKTGVRNGSWYHNPIHNRVRSLKRNSMDPANRRSVVKATGGVIVSVNAAWCSITVTNRNHRNWGVLLCNRRGRKRRREMQASSPHPHHWKYCSSPSRWIEP